jgi:hypothetical protein
MLSNEERCLPACMDRCTLIMVLWRDGDRGPQEHFSLVGAIATSTLQAAGSALAHVLPVPVGGS